LQVLEDENWYAAAGGGVVLRRRFAIFATLGEIVLQMLGVLLAVAILLDATVVRAVLLPATMKLLGDRD
jgi:uncharacterized membrane protein YdfJ with MMPL/SSD domain